MAARIVQPLTKSRSHASLQATSPSGACPVVVVVDVSNEAEDQDRTPRPQHQSIGPRSSSDTLRAKPSGTVSSAASSSTAASRNNGKNTNGYSNSSSNITDTAKVFGKPTAVSTGTPKFSLSSKKKRQQQREQEKQEQELKNQATEAIRQKHGEYHPPGQLSQGQIHTHRPQHHHDHHRLERSRSRSTHNLRHQHQYAQRNPSSVSIRIASPTPLSRPTSPSSALYSPSPSPTPSSSSSTHSSRHNSYDRGRHGRPTSPMRDLVHTHPHMNDLEGLDAEGMLSEHWDSSSSDHDHDQDQDHGPAGTSNDFERDHDRHRKASLDTSSSYRTSASSMVHFHDRPRSPSSSVASSHQSRNGYDRNRSAISIDSPHNYPSISQQIRPDSRQHRRPSLEMQEISKAQHASWSLNHFNASTTGIVTGLAPELNMSRPHSSQSRYRPTTPNSRDPIVERYLYSRAASPTNSGYQVADDEHNYLAPLPPFQQGPAYTRVPKRKFCRCCFGGCRWWVLLLLILIPAAVLAGAATFLLHRFRPCTAVDPNTLEPAIYSVDPAAVQGIVLEYKTRTKGTINIIDSLDKNETRVLLKLQRQFHGMNDRQDLTGFQIETLPNGYVRYILNDDADSQRGFFVPTVLCSQSILTVEMPMAAPERREIALDAMIDQQDVFINVDEAVHRNTSWRFRGISDHSMLVQSLNVKALSISYTSSAPASVILRSVIVREQLSVVSVSGDIQAVVGFTSSPSLPTNSSLLNSTFPASTSPTIQLNTLDGQVQLDFKARNQSCIFQINSPLIQVSKSGTVVLPFDRRNGSAVHTDGLVANAGYNSVSGTFWPPGAIMPVNPPGVNTTVPTTGLMTASVLATRAGTTRSAQLSIQANKNVIVNFP
ncbi:hypothetical protein BGZ70_000887 [Mortierella alpina]|uniref:Uncharacterized protein n=1 Tax=Mortierella alpina TaxID=64518 RepID=A0A9P6IWX6_MORAP|nr:hypothetical protein BGZ70_000887 [Mortierella alpina]